MVWTLKDDELELYKYTSRVRAIPGLSQAKSPQHSIQYSGTMRFSLLAAVTLVASSIAAPTENSLAVRESHLVDAEGKLNALAFDLEGFVTDPEAQKARTNVKRSKEEPLAKTSVIKHKSRKGNKKPYKKHPKRLISLKISSTGHKNGGEIVKSLDSAFDQIAPHTDNTGMSCFLLLVDQY